MKRGQVYITCRHRRDTHHHRHLALYGDAGHQLLHHRFQDHVLYRHVQRWLVHRWERRLYLPYAMSIRGSSRWPMTGASGPALPPYSVTVIIVRPQLSKPKERAYEPRMLKV